MSVSMHCGFIVSSLISSLCADANLLNDGELSPPAGVTTGPITVPFVLSLGVGFSSAVRSQEVRFFTCHYP